MYTRTLSKGQYLEGVLGDLKTSEINTFCKNVITHVAVYLLDSLNPQNKKERLELSKVMTSLKTILNQVNELNVLEVQLPVATVITNLEIKACEKQGKITKRYNFDLVNLSDGSSLHKYPAWMIIQFMYDLCQEGIEKMVLRNHLHTKSTDEKSEELLQNLILTRTRVKEILECNSIQKVDDVSVYDLTAGTTVFYYKQHVC